MIEINGKEYELKYPVNTLCMMAEDGIDVMNIGDITINISVIRDLFYYGLKHDNKKITKNQAGEVMDDYLEDGSMRDLIELVMGALAKSLGNKAKHSEEGNEAEDEGK